MNCELLLEFHGDDPELTRTLFQEPGGELRTAVRGKTAGAVAHAGTFQWTAAVRALSLILVQAAQGARIGDDVARAAIRGDRGSLAATLDYAISKEPRWTVDIFGTDMNGHSRIRRVLRRTNANRRYPGPVLVGLNPGLLAPLDISVWWGGERLTDHAQLSQLADRLRTGAGPAGEASAGVNEPEFTSLCRRAA